MEELAYLLAKSHPGAENYTEEELRNMSKEMAPFLEKMFGNMDRLTSGDVDARFNWWGTNSKPPQSAFKNNNGTIIYDPWLVLHVRSNPSVIDMVNTHESLPMSIQIHQDLTTAQMPASTSAVQESHYQLIRGHLMVKNQLPLTG